MNLKIKIILVILLNISAPVFGQNSFINIAQEKGINHSYGNSLPAGGVSFVDFNGDGLDDISFTSDIGSGLKFFINDGSSFSLIDLKLDSTDGESKQILWVDFDNDGDKDLYVTFLDSVNRLFRNEGNLTFSDITKASGLFRDILPTFSAAWADYDRDGYLDLYITDRQTATYNHEMSNHLYRNKGDGTFEETTLVANVADSSKAPFCAYFLDYNNDGWQDIYIAQDKNKINTLFRNEGNGSYTDVSAETNADLAISAMSVTVGDYDNNDYLDIYVSNIPEGNKLLRNDGFNYFIEVANNTGTGFFNVGWGAQFLDIDNDNDLDLYVSGSQPGVAAPSSALYFNNGNGIFELSIISGDTATSFSNAVGDFNNDGFLDIVVNNPNPFKAYLWSNQANSNNWIKINLEGTLSNRDAIGTRLEIFLDGEKYIQEKQCGTGFLGQNSSIVHFGLGQEVKVDSLIIKWPSGHIEREYNLTSNQTYSFLEGETNAYSLSLNITGEIILCSGDNLLLDTGLYSDLLNYIWSDGSEGKTLNVTEPGKYAVQVMNPGYGIQYVSDTLTVQVLSEQVADVETIINNISCLGENDGSINLNITGSSNYTVIWNDGLQGSNLDDLSAGTYRYIVTSESGCSVEGIVNISEPDSIGILIDQIHLDQQILVRAIASGGRSPYIYSWGHSSETSSEVYIVENGEYEVTVVDINGCSRLNTFTVDNSLVTAVDRIETSNKISIYPNPTNGDIIIHWSLNKGNVDRIVVRNVMGKEINRTSFAQFDNSIGFTLKGRPAGVYLITIVMKNGDTVVRKVLLD